MPDDQDVNVNITPEIEPEYQGFDYGQKASFGTTGTPYVGSRYAGPQDIPYPGAPPPGAMPAGVMPPIARTPPPQDYDAILQMRQDILSDARNQAATAGRFSTIGTPEFQNPVTRAYADQGIATAQELEAMTPLTFGGRFTQNMKGMGVYSLGFGAMQLSEGAAHAYAADNSGQYVTPEQQSTNAAGVLPGIGSIVGTLAGAAFGPGGALVGGFVGGAAGGVGQSVIAAANERAQDSRQGAEMLGTSAGDTAAKIRELNDAISGLQAPVGVVKDAIASIVTGVGPVGNVGGAQVAGLGNMVNALGEYAGQDYGSAARQLRDPALFPLQQQMTQNLRLDVGGYASLGASAILNNDPSSLIDRERDIQAATLTANPDYNAAKSDAANAPAWYDYVIAPGATVIRNASRLNSNRNADNIAANTAPNPAIAALDSYSADYRLTEYGTVLDQGRTGLASGALDAVGLRGGSLADVQSAGATLTSTLNFSAQDERMRGDVMRTMRDDPLFKGDKTELTREINKSDLTVQGYENSVLQTQKSVFTEGLGAETGQFSLSDTQGLLSGKSAADLLASRQTQAAYLTAQALDPSKPLMPSERLGMQESALRQSYGARMDVFAENLDINSVAQGRAGVSLARAEASGGPGQIAGAQGQEIEALGARFRELSEELKTAGQTAADYRREQQELNQVTAQGVQAVAARRQEYFAGVEGIDSANQGAARAGLPREVAIGGNSAFASVMGPDRHSVMDLTAAYNAAPAGSAERARAGAALASARATQAQDVTDLQTYRPGVGDRLHNENTEFQYSLSKLMPYTDAGGDPFSRGAALIAQDNSLSSRFRRDAASATDPLAREINTQQANQYALESAQLVRDERYAFAGMLPEMLAGGNGVGSAVLPFAAQSALMGGATPFTGSHGAAGPLGLMAQGAPSGGRAGAFSSQSTDTILTRILQVLESHNRPTSSVPQSHSGSVVSTLKKSLNANTLY